MLLIKISNDYVDIVDTKILQNLESVHNEACNKAYAKSNKHDFKYILHKLTYLLPRLINTTSPLSFLN